MANTTGSNTTGSNTTGRQPVGAPAGARGRRRSNREVARLLGMAVGLALLIAFVVDNSQAVKVGFVFFHKQISLIWALIIAAVLGALVDRLVIHLSERRRRAATKPD